MPLDIAIPEIHSASNPHELHILVASTGCVDAKITNGLLPRLARLPDCSVKAILDPGFGGKDFIDASESCLCVSNAVKSYAKTGQDVTEIEAEAAELCHWADMLVLAPIDANNMAKMLHGATDNLLLEVIRSWNVSKKILMVPGMSSLMWENPMTKKQLTKIRRKWNYVQVLQPVLWMFEESKKRVTSWVGMVELVETVKNQMDLMNIGQGIECSPTLGTSFERAPTRHLTVLPPELWTMIIDATGDWELARSLHIYTNLPAPPEWQRHASSHGPETYMEELEWTILTGTLPDVEKFIAERSVPSWLSLSRLCTKLIMRFAMTPLLAHLEAEHKDLFWSTFGNTFIPDKASSVFGRVEILDFWNTSPSFLTKKYTVEALDGASKQGFVHVLDWWQRSGLPLLFTEAALEQASSQGHMGTLEWWKDIGADQNEDSQRQQINLRPGKSICYATQAGRADVVRWWIQSGIPFAHEDTVAKLASTHGHVDVLNVWHDAKDSKMIFDNQVLICATKMGHVDVLEWWKQSGLRVEYKTCDVEEALEDGLEGRKGEEIRRWWAKNGLNLGVGTSEWMKPKVL